MIKDVFKLRKNAWHAKLMKYTWNLNFYDFSHMCPYFWLTIFNVIIFPLILFVKGFLRDCVLGSIFWIGEKLDSMAEARILKWEQSYFAELAKNPTKWDKLYEIDIDLDKNNRYRQFIYRQVRPTVSRDEFSKILEKFEAERQKRRDLKAEERNKKYLESLAKQAKFTAKYAKQQKRQKTNKERINSILKIVKPIAKGFLYLLAIATIIAVVFLLWKLFVVLASISAKAWISFGIGTAIVLAIIVFLILFIFGVRAGIIKIDENIKAKRANTYVVAREVKARKFTAQKIALGIAYPFIQIAKFIAFMLQMVKDSCPAIKWEE